MAEDSPDWTKIFNLTSKKLNEFQVAQTQIFTAKEVIEKLLKAKAKERSLKTARRKLYALYKEITIKLTADF